MGKKKMAARDEMKTKGHGEYEEIVETEFLKKVTGSNLVVCHFYHKEFERCKIVDMHLGKLAKRCFGTKFMKLNVEKSPFFVDKLKICVIPTLVFFQDGIAKHHMRGFDEVGGMTNSPLPNSRAFAICMRLWRSTSIRMMISSERVRVVSRRALQFFLLC